jgi:hypothetical protein
MMNDPALHDLLNPWREAERQLAERRQPRGARPNDPSRAALRWASWPCWSPGPALPPRRRPDVQRSRRRGAVHQSNIQAIGNAGITTGFEDPNNTSARLYNPKGQVTREEMASFLARTAGGNPPVVNANTAVTANSASSADRAMNADTATTRTCSTTSRAATTNPPGSRS